MTDIARQGSPMPSTAATTPALRARIAAVIVLLACAPSLACITTSMTAGSARVPVLVGPVACIGCSAASSPVAPAGAPISDGTHYSNGYMWLPYLGDVDYFGAKPPEIDLKAESMAPDACKGEIRVSGLKVESFGLVAFLYARTTQTVDLTGEVLAVPSGTCGPRPWPYSGPQGIVYLAPEAAAGGSP